MSGRQLLSNATYGETFAYRLLQPRDLPQVMHDARLDMMAASAYLFATKSAWLGEAAASCALACCRNGCRIRTCWPRT